MTVVSKSKIWCWQDGGKDDEEEREGEEGEEEGEKMKDKARKEKDELYIVKMRARRDKHKVQAGPSVIYPKLKKDKENEKKKEKDRVFNRYTR